MMLKIYAETFTVCVFHIHGVLTDAHIHCRFWIQMSVTAIPYPLPVQAAAFSGFSTFILNSTC